MPTTASKRRFNAGYIDGAALRQGARKPPPKRTAAR